MKWELQGWVGDKTSTHWCRLDEGWTLFVLRYGRSSSWKYIVKQVKRPEGRVLGCWSGYPYASREKAQKAAEVCYRRERGEQ